MTSTMAPVEKPYLQLTLDTLADRLSLNDPSTPQACDKRVFQPKGYPKQCIIDGEIWPAVFEPEKVRSAKKLKVRDDDVFVCTYPKCGTTWVQHICAQLMEKFYDEGQVSELSFTSPMIEKMGAEYCDKLESPRLLKTHFNYHNTPKSKKAKYIFVGRNPKDCVTSYYHHNLAFKLYNWADGDFNTFVELFCTGQLAFGDYFDHLYSWMPHVNDENVLFVTYEQMSTDLRAQVVRIGNFLGGRAKEMVEDDEILSNIVDDSYIDSMRKKQHRYFPQGSLNLPFFRRGGVRNWTNYLNARQSNQISCIWRARFLGTEALNWWRDEICWDPDAPDALADTPDIVVTADEEEFDSEELCSVSRRVSCFLSPDFIPERRLSVMSSGFGSVWSLAVQQAVV
ncbi:unnamed protein product [Bursaphelenchus xylophilus]|uniref:(pine wood nematode) hypothetical protein n=1 Tax=Bursaphelenchus xylophilus TaxID=6326 RepID=A0A1I7RTS9_BURXY|nr:unnamed protein product [Bursaphelenchus xylophilus]CAG9122145.1 unnamed protein product [Bursaphelenchus xylophilus]